MPLADVNRLLGFVDAPLANCSDVDLLVDEQLARVRARLKSLRALEKQLLQLRARCSGTHQGHCGILDELVSAAHGEACVCHAGSRHSNDRQELETRRCYPHLDWLHWVKRLTLRKTRQRNWPRQTAAPAFEPVQPR